MKIKLPLIIITLLVVITAIWQRELIYFWYGLLVPILLTFISLIVDFIIRRKADYYKQEE
jgi:hypothetical protein